MDAPPTVPLQQPPTGADICLSFERELATLTFNCKPIITSLSIAADAAMKAGAASAIVRLVENRIHTAPPDQKLPAMYLMDSILKVVRGEYIELFARSAVRLFTIAWHATDQQTRAALLRMLGTWRAQAVFDERTLQEVELRAKYLGAGSGATQPPQPQQPQDRFRGPPPPPPAQPVYALYAPQSVPMAMYGLPLAPPPAYYGGYPPAPAVYGPPDPSMIRGLPAAEPPVGWRSVPAPPASALPPPEPAALPAQPSFSEADQQRLISAMRQITGGAQAAGPQRRYPTPPQSPTVMAAALSLSLTEEIQRLYCGFQCAQCGVRLRTPQEQSAHAALHPKETAAPPKSKDGQQKSRSWYQSLSNWVASARAENSVDTLRALGDMLKTSPSSIVLQTDAPCARADEKRANCSICGERFAHFLDKDDEWMFSDCVESNGAYVHSKCLGVNASAAAPASTDIRTP